ncbi:MAG: cellulase family glycosylhydrolase [Fibrobacteria bacterium]|nr:cellulase family glycosylhydrolase [Fibrobacteria bacterium]
MNHVRRTGLCMALALSSYASAGVVSQHGALKVVGNKVVDAHDQPIQLAGMSLYWPVWGGEKFFNAQAVATIVDDWGASLVRAPIAVYTPNSNPSYLYKDSHKALIRTVVDAAIAKDVYVLIDWHVEQDSPYKETAIAFFTEMAQTYGKDPHVLFEIWNEPARASWDDVKAYAIDVVAAIRKHSDNLVIVGSPEWSKAVDRAAASPLTLTNIAYTYHFYACTHGATERTRVRNAAAKIPIMFTEWGTTSANGGGDVCTDETKQWLDLAKELGISWANWSLSNKSESSAALATSASSTGPWNDGALSNSGRYVVGKIREVAQALGDGITDPPEPLDTASLPGRIEVEKAPSMSSELQTETTQDEGGGENVGYTAPGSWLELPVRVQKTGNHLLRVRVATENAGRIEVKLGGRSLGAFDVASTGGWQTWKTLETGVTLDATGVSTLRAEWSGNGTSLVNLNWIEVVAGALSVGPGAPVGSGLRAARTTTGWTLALPPQALSWSLLDLQGRILDQGSLQGKTTLELASGPAGLAMVRIETATGTVVQALPFLP